MAVIPCAHPDRRLREPSLHLNCGKDILVTTSMDDCVWQVRGGHAPLGPVQRRPGEVRPLPSHRVGGGAVLRLQGAGPEQGGCEPGFPCV